MLKVIPDSIARNDQPIQSSNSSNPSSPGFSIPFPAPTREIAWSDSAQEVSGNVDQDFKFKRPKSVTISKIYGTGLYTAGSSICSAAVHTELLSAREGGNVRIQILGPQEFFNGTERNGVSSRKYGA
ncbi:MAG: LCCL domain-containing protein [Phormidesmis sp.]